VQNNCNNTVSNNSLFFSECLEYEVRNQKKRIDILEEKNYDHEQEIFDLKNIVRNIRIDLDHVSAEHIQNGDSKDDRPSQHGAPLPSDYGALKSKRPSRLLPLQLIKYKEISRIKCTLINRFYLSLK